MDSDTRQNFEPSIDVQTGISQIKLISLDIGPSGMPRIKDQAQWTEEDLKRLGLLK